MSKEKELITITASAVELYEGGGLTVLLDEIEKRALELVPDVTTTKGRDALRTNAATVTSYKTKLFQLGKDLTEEHRNKVQSINSVRNSMEERLNTLKDKVRKPLTDYEEIEKARVAKVEKMIQLIKDYAFCPLEDDSSQIANKLTQLQGIIVDDSFGDLETPAFIEKEKSIEKLTAQLETVKQREIDKAELEELRKGKAEQEEKERQGKEKQYQADREKQILKEAAEIAEREKVEAAERAEREKEQAIEAERERVAAEKELERKASEKREANKKHCAKINNAAVAALEDLCACEEDHAKEIITAIAKGLIPNVKINY